MRGACVTLLAMLLWAQPALATDFLAPRVDGGAGFADGAYYELGLGADVDFFAEYLGARLGALVALRDFIDQGPNQSRLMLTPEVAVHPGDDGDVLRYFLVLQVEIGLTGFGAPIAPLHGLRVGPQIEWRDTPEGARVALGVFYAATRRPDGDVTGAGAMLRLSVAYAFGTEEPLRPPPDAPTCPDRAPPIEGFGCEPAR